MPFTRTFAAANLILLSSGAQAMTGSEFLEKLNDQQRASYADGAIEMVSYGMEEHKAGCVIDWYYKGPSRSS